VRPERRISSLDVVRLASWVVAWESSCSTAEDAANWSTNHGGDVGGRSANTTRSDRNGTSVSKLGGVSTLRGSV